MGDAEILDLYKLAVELADRVSARRTTANAFFLTLHTALLSGIGFSQGLKRLKTANLSLLFIVAAGFILSAAWWLLLRSYRDLNEAKFKVIQEMEKEMATQVFSREWKYLKEDRVKGWRGRYAEQGAVERAVPVVFAFLYAGFAALVLLGP